MKEQQHFTIEESSITFASVSNANPQVQCAANAILILPSSSEHRAFFHGTLELRDHFVELAPETPITIAATDEDYRELTLHSADFWIGTFLVGTVAAPVLVNLLSSYIFEWLKAKPGDKISIDVIVEKDGKSTMVSYKGDAKDFPKVVTSVRKLTND